MNNTKHTPGPWHIGMKPGPMIYGSDSSQVADLRADLLDKGERAANARLIAAAPELLACLIDAVRCLEFAAPIIEAPENSAYRETIAQARAAIVKATGGAK